ncbi:hypothetical protein F4808DRAFT_333025 [Astrocystis sublimbata]|nr:hypothetical protein F4808DRAFT_333025 [Astrocystis sublimbata]
MQFLIIALFATSVASVAIKSDITLQETEALIPRYGDGADVYPNKDESQVIVFRKPNGDMELRPEQALAVEGGVPGKEVMPYSVRIVRLVELACIKQRRCRSRRFRVGGSIPARLTRCGRLVGARARKPARSATMRGRCA